LLFVVFFAPDELGRPASSPKQPATATSKITKKRTAKKASKA
jgi:hypothetical protein